MCVRRRRRGRDRRRRGRGRRKEQGISSLLHVKVCNSTERSP